MCGIAGMFNPDGIGPDAEAQIGRMLSSLRHRGPDEFGIYLDQTAVLGSARLSIIDISTGQQPIANEDETLWIVFNGEVFNYLELRAGLERRGHRFTTHSDTETILHLYEEMGPECLSRLNGQFAIAIWDVKCRRLCLARDRLGVRPLFYARDGGTFLFGSEIKALFNGASLAAEMDPGVVRDIFTFWAPLPMHTVFRGVVAVPPGHYLLAQDDNVRLVKYWELEFEGTPLQVSSPAGDRSTEDYVEEFRDLLVQATRLRLQADVPVGAYLSGGLDSSTIAAVIRRYTGNRLDTFSIAFTDTTFDESQFQRQMASFLGTEHHVVEATHADIGRVFPEVIWHTEVPVMRTAPAPMFLLSRLVRDRGYKVVLTGEGADEFLAGYDIFKELKVRRFWARRPDSKWRHRLLGRLYPDIFGSGQRNDAFLGAFFGERLTEVETPAYSHAIRWRNNRRTCRFFEGGTLRPPHDAPGASLPVPAPPAFGRWSDLERAQYLEIVLFLCEYLLSSQGDRMAMAHSVEGRFPFLDCHVVEFCRRLPGGLKMRGLQEKYLLRQVSRAWLPPEIWRRRKRPYRAPIHRSFFHDATPDYVRELLSPGGLKRSGFFNPTSVGQLVSKLEQGRPVGETDDMALAGILSTQLVHFQFVQSFRVASALPVNASTKICRQRPIPERV